MDGNNVLVRGRLKISSIPGATMYHIILHENELSIGLMIEHAHDKCMHIVTDFIRIYLQRNWGLWDWENHWGKLFITVSRAATFEVKD